MKKYKFKLQNVLDLREKELEKKQIEFGKIKFLLRSQEVELERIEYTIEASKNNLESLLSSGAIIDIDTINSNQNHIEQTHIKKEEQIKLIKETEIALAQKNLEVVEALKAKTMLEKLKEKDYKNFLKTLEEHERKELDEIGIMKYARTR
ncbi:MAG: flagellar export protein FliJ [Eubacteriales bacterium]|nr:flagellar export protein FliJ [Eubacteriales bacterium]